MMADRLHLMIKGDVQGVFFRDFVKKQSKFLNLKGWVRNTPEGNVEVVAEGGRENLLRLSEKCIRGPIIAKVEKIDLQWENPTGAFNDFEIRY